MAVVRAKSDRQVGRYQLVYELGQSYLGPLWAVKTESADGVAQLGMLRLVSLAGLDADTRVRLLEAAWQAMEIRDTRVAPVGDVVASDGELGVIADYTEGLPLKSLQGLASVRRRAFPVPVALRIAKDLGLAVAALHAAMQELGGDAVPLFGGITPDSLLVGSDGTTRVLDVVVASAATGIPSLGGSPERAAYAAPEQLAEAPRADAKSDVFTAGVLLWELLSSRRLFMGSDKGVVQKVLSGKIPKLDEVKRRGDPDLPAPLVALVARALERDSGARFESVEAFTAALDACGVAAAPDSAVAAFVDGVAEGALGRVRDALRDAPSGSRSMTPQPSKAPKPPTQRPIQPPPGLPVTPTRPAPAATTVTSAARPPLAPSAPAAARPNMPRFMPKTPTTAVRVTPGVGARAGLPGGATARPGAGVARQPDAGQLPPARKRQPTMIGIAPAANAQRRPPTESPPPTAAAPVPVPPAAPGAAAASAAPGPAAFLDDDPTTQTLPETGDDEPTGQYDARTLLKHVEAMSPLSHDAGRAPATPPKVAARPPESLPPESVPVESISEFPEPHTGPTGRVTAVMTAAADPAAEIGSAIDTARGAPQAPDPPGALTAADSGGWLDGPPSSMPPPAPEERPAPAKPVVAEVREPSPVPAFPKPAASPAFGPPASLAPVARVTERAPAPKQVTSPPPAFLPSQIPPPLIHDPRAKRVTERPEPREAPPRRRARGLLIGLGASVALVAVSAIAAVFVLRSGSKEAATEVPGAIAAPAPRAPAVKEPEPAQATGEPAAPSAVPTEAPATEKPEPEAATTPTPTASAVPAAPTAAPRPAPLSAKPVTPAAAPKRAPPKKKKGQPYNPTDI